MLRPVTVGESLRTETTVLGLADATPKNGAQRGKVWLGIVTSAANEPVITYERCALIRSESAEPLGHASVIPGPSESVALRELYPAVPTWRIDLLPESGWAEGQTRIDPLRDHIDLAAPFARLTFNQAAIHRDATTSANGQRLVYGGHVQGLAQASLTRMLPSLATVLAWDGCDHLAPAAEGDLLEFHHTLIEELPVGTGRILRLETIGARVEESGQTKDILRWTPVVWAR
jgi:acyl dehydratase